MVKLPEAENSFRALINHSPEYRQAYYFLGITYGKQRKLADAHYTLGIYYLKMGNPSKARKQFEKALENTTDEAKRDKLKKMLRRLSGKDAEEAEAAKQDNEG